MNYDMFLKKIESRISKMASAVYKSLFYSFSAIYKDDEQMAMQAIALEDVINQSEREIDDLISKFLTLYKPYGDDLRFIISCLHIIGYLERIADHSVNISNVQVRLEHHQEVDLGELRELYENIDFMMSSTIKAFSERDISLARLVAKFDEQVDAMYEIVYTRMLSRPTTDVRDVEIITSYILVARYFERIGDYITNICERIIFLISGLKEHY